MSVLPGSLSVGGGNRATTHIVSPGQGLAPPHDRPVNIGEYILGPWNGYAIFTAVVGRSRTHIRIATKQYSRHRVQPHEECFYVLRGAVVDPGVAMFSWDFARELWWKATNWICHESECYSHCCSLLH